MHKADLVLLKPSALVYEPNTKEMRSNELTCLMVACIMGNHTSVKYLVEKARECMTSKQFHQFLNVKTSPELGGNNALLYAASTSK